jgi:alkyl sulfatase BDS1-like metallo-beta-lactamase superfamily hydrolase
VEFLAMQRDMYLYLHDQALRLINQGYVGAEIAEMLEMPPALQAAWHAHGYYGSVSHNLKAIYQRYMGWYDGNPANLWAHPPVEAAQRYVAAMGGVGAAVETARQAYDEGDYRWVVEVCKHILFADDTSAAARTLHADALEQLGFGAENGTWRNAFLSGAHELRHGQFGSPTVAASPDLLAAVSVDQMLDSIAIRIDGPKAWPERLALSFVITDTNTTYTAELRNGVLHHRVCDSPAADSTTFTLTRPTLIGLVTGTVNLADAIANGDVGVDGDPADLGRLVSLLAPVDPDFAIVTP